MSEEDRVIEIIRDALQQHNPQSLKKISEYFSAWDSLLKLIIHLLTAADIPLTYQHIPRALFWLSPLHPYRSTLQSGSSFLYLLYHSICQSIAI